MEILQKPEVPVQEPVRKNTQSLFCQQSCSESKVVNEYSVQVFVLLSVDCLTGETSAALQQLKSITPTTFPTRNWTEPSDGNERCVHQRRNLCLCRATTSNAALLHIKNSFLFLYLSNGSAQGVYVIYFWLYVAQCLFQQGFKPESMHLVSSRWCQSAGFTALLLQASAWSIIFP